METNKLYCKSSEEMKEINDKSIDLIITSPPYNIDINYGNKWEKGKKLEPKGKKYKDNLSEDNYRILLEKVFSECTRVLKEDGSFYLNMKSRLINESLVPPFWVLEFLKEFYLKNIIIWSFDWGGSTNKRFSSRYEFVLFLTKDKKNWTFNLDDVKIPSLNFRPDRYKSQYKNPTDVWKIPIVSGNSPERTSHPAQYPEKLIERIIKASSNNGDIVLDPFVGSGTTAVVANKLNRRYIGYDTSKEYIATAKERLLDEKQS
tara:strand:+ start:445 stop:1224 length:780 start_codon:yes stop_codon:yes gene_type:complete